MRAASALLQLAVCLSTVTPLAFASPESLPHAGSLVIRQDDESNNNNNDNSNDNDNKSDDNNKDEEEEASTTAAETGATGTITSAEATSTNDDDEDSKTTGGRDRNTARPTESDDDDAKETGTRTSKGKDKDSKSTSISIPHDVPIGAVSITEPVTSAMPTPLYKIGENVTLGWNYTDLYETPDAIDVLISCAAVSATWTLTANMTFENEPSYTWSTEDQAENDENPLLTEMYTLIIKDTEAEVSEIPQPGKLGSNQNFKFGLYYPQKYVPWDEFECTGCSAAPGGSDIQAVKLAVGMSFVTFFTFTYFVTGWGLN